jgi:hypothetical protein
MLFLVLLSPETALYLLNLTVYGGPFLVPFDEVG